MKKVILSVLVVGSLLATSCKKVKEGANAVKEGTESVVEKTGDAVKEGANAVKEGAEKTVDAGANVVKDGVDAVKEGANAVKEGAEGAVKAGADAVKGGVNAVKDAVASITIPDFGNEKVNAYAKSYTEYAKEYISAKGNVLKGGLAQKGQELATKGQEVMKGLDAGTAKKLGTFISQLNEKMVASTKK